MQGSKPVSSGCDRLRVSSCCPRVRPLAGGFLRGFCSCPCQNDDKVGDYSHFYEFYTGEGTLPVFGE